MRNSYRIYIPFVRTTIDKNILITKVLLYGTHYISLCTPTLATFKSRYSSLYFPQLSSHKLPLLFTSMLLTALLVVVVHCNYFIYTQHITEDQFICS